MNQSPVQPDPKAPNPEIAVVLAAPAKLTLSLRVTGVRADGYHLLEAEMVTLDLTDELELSASHTDGPGSLAVSLAGDLAEWPAEQLVSNQPADNLVTQALQLAGRQANVKLRKLIPPGAGLGGGSANAAAVLRWAGEHDLARAATLGADVPFCLVGGRAKVSGIGEVVEPLPYLSETYTLLTPPFGCSTAAVYRAWDELGGPQGDWGNDLESAALHVEPRLKQYRAELEQASGQRPRLAGSGSTWFVAGEFPGDNRRVVTTTPQLLELST